LTKHAIANSSERRGCSIAFPHGGEAHPNAQNDARKDRDFSYLSIFCAPFTRYQVYPYQGNENDPSRGGKSRAARNRIDYELFRAFSVISRDPLDR